MKKPGSKVIVLDAWAMMAYLNLEPSAQEVRQVLRRAMRGEILALFSLINYGECLYVVERKKGPEEVQRSSSAIDQLPVRIVPVDRPLVFAAARLKARYPISYADAFAAAVAKRYGGRVMTGDPEFKAVDPEVVIHWLPTRRR